MLTSASKKTIVFIKWSKWTARKTKYTFNESPRIVCSEWRRKQVWLWTFQFIYIQRINGSRELTPRTHRPSHPTLPLLNVTPAHNTFAVLHLDEKCEGIMAEFDKKSYLKTDVLSPPRSSHRTDCLWKCGPQRGALMSKGRQEVRYMQKARTLTQDSLVKATVCQD